MPNIIRIDSTSLNFRQGEIFDAVITDPPYGIRAMSRSISKKEEEIQNQDDSAFKIDEEQEIPKQEMKEEYKHETGHKMTELEENNISELFTVSRVKLEPEEPNDEKV